MTYAFSITLSFSSILCNSTANSEVSIKIQTMNLVLNVLNKDSLCFIYLDVIIRQQLKKKFNPVKRANEVKTCGLVQQRILRMLRDVILQSCDSHLLNGDLPLENLSRSSLIVCFQSPNWPNSGGADSKYFIGPLQAKTFFLS